jgi:hypothetical protein
VSAFQGTGVWQDEGQHLQDVFRPAADHGGPGRFAFDHSAHLTEASPLVSDESRRRLWSAWSRHWDLSAPVLLEKSPPNLIRMRFFEAMFPGRARFVVVTRHPVAVAFATRRWTQRFDWIPPRIARRVPLLEAGLGSLLHHWVVAHERFLADAALVRSVCLVRYEDLVAEPATELGRIFRFVGLSPIEAQWDVRAALNDPYLASWNRARSRALRRGQLESLVRRFEGPVHPFGYSLSAPERLSPPSASVARYWRNEV